MFTNKEVAWIVISIIIFEFMVLFPMPNPFNPIILLVPVIVILTSVFTKKLAANVLSIRIEHKMWEFYRWGFYRRSYSKKPFPMGLVFPIALTIFSLGSIKPFVFLQFEYENIHEKRLLRERGRKRRMEINDSDPGFTAAWGFYSLLLLAIIGAVFKFPELIKYSIYYGAWNLVPFGSLDGMKLFFGSIIAYAFLVLFYIIALALVLMYVVW